MICEYWIRFNFTPNSLFYRTSAFFSFELWITIQVIYQAFRQPRLQRSGLWFYLANSVILVALGIYILRLQHFQLQLKIKKNWQNCSIRGRSCTSWVAMNREIYTEQSNRNRNSADYFIVRNRILLNIALKVVNLNIQL